MRKSLGVLQIFFMLNDEMKTLVACIYKCMNALGETIHHGFKYEIQSKKVNKKLSPYC